MVCRVPHTIKDTWQTAIGKKQFIESFLADTWQKLCRVLSQQKEKKENGQVTASHQVVAVEFDTALNTDWDTSSQHVGIDVNSIKSVSYANTSSPEMMTNTNKNNLTSGSKMTATVRYDNVSKLLAVDLWVGDTLYLVNATVDLKSELPAEVAVGFSAGTGKNYEAHRVLSWSFNSTLEAGKVALDPTTSSPAPASPAPPIPKLEPSEKLLSKVLIPVASVSVLAVVFLLLWMWWKQPARRTGEPNGDPAGFDDMGMVGPRRSLPENR